MFAIEKDSTIQTELYKKKNSICFLIQLYLEKINI